MSQQAFGRRNLPKSPPLTIAVPTTPRDLRMLYMGLAVVPALLLGAYALSYGYSRYSEQLAAQALEESVHAAAVAEEERRQRLISLSQEQIRGMLKDGESARFSDVWWYSKGSDQAVCGYVNSKNGYGAYAGKSKWVADYGNGMVYLLSEEKGPGMASWAKYCQK